MRSVGRTGDTGPSDEERAAAVDRLQASVGRGELNLEEFITRLDVVYGADYHEQIQQAVVDIPVVARPPGPLRPIRRTIAILGDASRTGPWDLAGRTTAVSVLGSVELDLRAAYLLDGARIDVWSVLGSANVLLPQGVDVTTSGFGFFGTRTIEVNSQVSHPGAPRIRIRAYSLFGDTQVRDRVPARPLLDWMRRVLGLPAGLSTTRPRVEGGDHG